MLVFALIGVSVPQILNDLPNPSRPESMTRFYGKLRSQVGGAVPFSIEPLLPADPEQSGVYQELKKFLQGEQITNLLLSLSGQGLGILTEAVLVLFILLFLLVEGQMLTDKIRLIFGPGPDVQSQVSEAFGETAESVRSYLVWRTIVNLGLGIVLGGVYAAVGLKQPALWALLTIIFCYIPYLGTIAAGVMPILDALLNVSPWAAFGLLLFYMAVVTIEGYIIVPWVMGRSMDLNATTVMLACLYWHLVWGIAGLFLAMPIMAAIKAICLHVDVWQPWGNLMSSEDEPPSIAGIGYHESHGTGTAAALDPRLAAVARQAELNGTDETTVVMESPLPPETLPPARPGR
jgi:predicted PurR-regulated permease PerM